MKLKIRARDEKGAVLVIVAIVMTALLTLSAGGVLVFTLYGANREMQKAADQAAVAGAAALPLLRPGEVLDNLPLNRVYNLTEPVGLDVPLKGLSNVPDPRAVACAYGHYNLGGPQGDLTAPEGPNARLIKIYGSAADPSLGGFCAGAPWNEQRVLPTLNSLPLSTCVTSLTSEINSLITSLQSGLTSLLSNPLLNLLLAPLGLSGSQVTATVNSTVARLNGVLDSVKNLEALSPALLTPEMTVMVRSGVNPPMMSLITGSNGIQMTVQATAERRLKNAIVVPDVTAGLPLTSGMPNVDINTALEKTKPDVINALATVNTQLNTLMGAAPAGLNLSGCHDLLSPSSKVVQAVSDIYNPPGGGPAPSGRSLINGALTNAQNAAANSGQALDNIAGEGFLVIRQGPTPTTISNLLGPVFDLLGLSSTVGNLSIPAMDVVVIAAHNLEDGNISNPDLIPDIASARGLFTATLVK